MTPASHKTFNIKSRKGSRDSDEFWTSGDAVPTNAGNWHQGINESKQLAPSPRQIVLST
jgi:hypothetical protein